MNDPQEAFRLLREALNRRDVERRAICKAMKTIGDILNALQRLEIVVTDIKLSTLDGIPQETLAQLFLALAAARKFRGLQINERSDAGGGR